jgi:D-lactate dehydrogenase
MLPPSYETFAGRVRRAIPAARLLSDPLSTLAYGTDASFYRLIPKLVAVVESEAEVIALLREAYHLGLPVTFRAAGTSLSGQAISDSILVVLGRSWRSYVIHEGAALITLQPGVVGGHANIALAPHGAKIGPDPASINAATVGGIAANNASGMCCGTAQNSYRTLESMRIIFADGSVLDTGSAESRQLFVASHLEFVQAVERLGDRLRSNVPLAERIRRKFKMKNTTGYSLNALVDYTDPIDIIAHLMIGSEGTLGFISEITYRTVPELPHKATALMLFPDIEIACQAVATLKRCPVDAVELMDRAALRSVERKPGMPDYLKGLGPKVASLLVETRAPTEAGLQTQIREITSALGPHPVVRPLSFTTDPDEYTALWNIRKGLFPSVGAMREAGTTVIIEDVAFPVPRLAEATLDLQALFLKHGYDGAIIFGHSLEGNLHFVFTQDFNNDREVSRYAAFIEEVTSLVVRRYDGSLKAEHGTGRNMAPFVELEWGREACELMQEIKTLFDPKGILNPGVILNTDPRVHLKNLKPLPAAHPVVDTCIECGFCEVHCPSRDLTLTPRQRIVAYREIARLRAQQGTAGDLRKLEEAYRYAGDQTCATDGLCALSCPVNIDTGSLVKILREESSGRVSSAVASFAASHFRATAIAVRTLLRLADSAHALLGTRFMSSASRFARKISGETLPLWNPAMPRAADRLRQTPSEEAGGPSVVYFPSCINRVMGPARGDDGDVSVSSVTFRLLKKAGFTVVLPAGLESLCCGMAFASKGYRVQGDAKARELERALAEASQHGSMPVLFDMSPCLYRMREVIGDALPLQEPVQFTLEHLVPRLQFRKLHTTVAFHTTCSAQKMGLAAASLRLAELCADQVVVPEGIECCGWAGDRGFTVPELNASALHDLKEKLPEGCAAGYSTSRTCEIGLSLHSGIPYRSILALVDSCTAPRSDNSPSR